MKKLLCIALVAFLLFLSFPAVAENNDPNTEEDISEEILNEEPAENPDEDPEEDPVEEPEEQDDQNEDPAEEPEQPEDETDWEGILAAGFFDAEEPVTLKGDLVLPAEQTLFLHGGELTLEPGSSLTVEGFLLIEGGSLIIPKEASLTNCKLILVTETGALCVEGDYAQTQSAIFMWDDVRNAAKVDGVKNEWIDKTIYVGNTKSMNNSLSRDGYRTLTVVIPFADYVTSLKSEIPEGVILSVR